jgi:formylglycine-generating enzyme required for sulfatase activity
MDRAPVSLDGKKPWTGVTYKEAANYCAARGKRLPTTNEWEYAAHTDKNLVMRPVARGGVWEWTSDYHHHNSAHCANGIVQTKDVSDYDAFMRYSLRSTLKENSSMSSLGFRCVV